MPCQWCVVGVLCVLCGVSALLFREGVDGYVELLAASVWMTHNAYRAVAAGRVPWINRDRRGEPGFHTQLELGQRDGVRGCSEHHEPRMSHADMP